MKGHNIANEPVALGDCNGILGLYKDNGQENGNYRDYGGYIWNDEANRLLPKVSDVACSSNSSTPPYSHHPVELR